MSITGSTFLHYLLKSGTYIGLTATLWACSGPEDKEPVPELSIQESARTDTSVRADSLEFTDPKAQLARYLEAMIATRPFKPGENRAGYVRELGTYSKRIGEPDSAYSRGCGEEYMDDRFLAAYQILSVVPNGDTAIGRVAVTTVASQTELGDGSIHLVTQKVSEDTAQWQLVRSPDTKNKWMVCGDTKEGFNLIHKEARVVRWKPQGASLKTVYALVDSIRNARRLPPAHNDTK